MAIVENIQREDLNPLEEASALQRLLGEFGLTHQEIAKSVGKSRTTVTNLIRLLDLNPEVKEMVERGEIEMGHTRALLALQGATQTAAATKVAAKGLSVRETEALVRRLSQPPKPSAEPVEEDPDVRRLLSDLTDRLGAKVSLQQGAGNSGRLVISYNNLEELEGGPEAAKEKASVDTDSLSDSFDLDSMMAEAEAAIDSDDTTLNLDSAFSADELQAELDQLSDLSVLDSELEKEKAAAATETVEPPTNLGLVEEDQPTEDLGLDQPLDLDDAMAATEAELREERDGVADLL